MQAEPNEKKEQNRLQGQGAGNDEQNNGVGRAKDGGGDLQQVIINFANS